MPDDHGATPPGEEKTFLGIPYDFSRPTVARFKSRWWNPNDRRFFTPRVFGWGYDLNLYWAVHPGAYRRAKQGRVS